MRQPPVFRTPRRVVVTGLGIVSPIGVGAEYCWKRLTSRACGITTLEGEEFASLPSRVAGVVPRGTGDGQFDPGHWVEPHEARRHPLNILFGLAAAKQALGDARWFPDDPKLRARTGVAIGCGISGVCYPRSFSH